MLSCSLGRWLVQDVPGASVHVVWALHQRHVDLLPVALLCLCWLRGTKEKQRQGLRVLGASFFLAIATYRPRHFSDRINEISILRLNIFSCHDKSHDSLKLIIYWNLSIITWHLESIKWDLTYKGGKPQSELMLWSTVISNCVSKFFSQSQSWIIWRSVIWWCISKECWWWE